MKIRIKFRKYGAVRFVGHLDIMRFFQKAIRRVGIDICYSEGFSPHQIMSFAAPLGVGLYSDGEYLDIEVNSTKSSQESIAALNGAMVDGLEVIDYVRLDDKAKNATSLVAAADYTMINVEDPLGLAKAEDLQTLIDSYYTNRQEIMVVKKTKKSERELDLKPLIYTMKAVEEEGHVGFFLSLSTGSTDNIKPELVVEDFCKFHDLAYDRYAFTICRKEVYADVEGKKVPLGDLGERI